MQINLGIDALFQCVLAGFRERKVRDIARLNPTQGDNLCRAHDVDSSGDRHLVGIDAPVAMRLTEDSLNRPHPLRHGSPELLGETNVWAAADEPPLVLRRLLEQLDEVEPLPIRVVEGVEPVWEDEVEVLVAPGPVRDERQVFIEVLLQLQVVGI